MTVYRGSTESIMSLGIDCPLCGSPVGTFCYKQVTQYKQETNVVHYERLRGMITILKTKGLLCYQDSLPSGSCVPSSSSSEPSSTI